MKLRTHCLRKGTLLYHGTSVAEPFEQNSPPAAPAWFSTVLWVAESFIDWRYDEQHGSCPRVLVYYLLRDMRLAVGELQEVLQAFGTSTPAQVCCAQWDGWIMPNQYRSHVPAGDDIMLCDTSVLRFVKRICL